MSKSPVHPRFWRYFLVGLGWMAFTSGIHELADRTWLVKRLETANLDALFSGKKQTVSNDVVVVSITDEDYKDEFGEVSPLDPKKLMNVIDAILAEKPKALGIDFDTSGWPSPPPDYTGRPIVWAREAMGEPGSLRMGNVLGGAKGVCYGVPAYFPDEDGIVREYKEFIEGADHTYYPSLAFNLVQVSKGKECAGDLATLDRKDAGDLEKVNFRGSKNTFDHVSVKTLLRLSNLGAGGPQPLAGKLVLLGGGYRAARDAYPTPYRYMDGVDIIANTVDMNLHKKLGESPLWLYIGGYVEGVVLLAALYFVSRKWSLIITVLTGPIYALLVSWLAFQWGATFISFVPCFVGIVIHEIVQHTHEYHQLQTENLELEGKVKELRSAAKGFLKPSHRHTVEGIKL